MSASAPRGGIALLLLTITACEHDEGGPDLVDESSIDVTVDETTVTLVRVAVETVTEAEVRVEYGLDGAFADATPASTSGTSHSLTLLGLKPDTTYTLRVVASSPDGEDTSSPLTVTTGELPGELPRFEVVTPAEAGTWGSYSLMAMQAPGEGDPSGPIIVDDDGEIVWYSWGYHGSSNVYSGFTDDDGAVLYMDCTRSGEYDSTLVRIPLDRPDERETFDVGHAHHALAQVPGTLAAVITAESRLVGEELVAGDTIVELDEDGVGTVVWSAWDTMEVEQHAGWVSLGEDLRDWTHANGLYYIEDEDAYLVSLFWLETILKIDRASGQILWRLGGTHSDFAIAPDDVFGQIHSPHILADGRLAFFDNRWDEGSAIAVFSLDEQARRATRDETWVLMEGRRAAVVGEADALPDESWYSVWGDIGSAAVMGPDGEVRWHIAEEELTTVPGFGQRVETLYR